MATNEKKMERPLPAEITERGRDLWLAGLGAVVTVEEEGRAWLRAFEERGEKLLSNLRQEASKIFDELVQRGEKVQQEGVRKLGAVAEDVEEVQRDVSKKLDALVKDTVEALLARMDMPTRSEVRALTRKVEALARQVDGLTALLQAGEPVETGDDVNAGAAEATWTVYRVEPHDEGWAVIKEGNERATSVHETKVAAVDAARELARRHAPARLVIFRKDGTIQDENTYPAE